jgi:signal transduction histidine kinase
VSPYTGEECAAFARQAVDGSVLVLLGGSPAADAVRTACDLLPLVACALKRERQELHAQHNAHNSQRIAEQARTLARGLETARRELQVALHAAEEMRHRSAFLAEASTVLASSLDYDATAEGIARLSVPFVSDWCFVDLVGEDGRLRRVAVAGDDHDGRATRLHEGTRGSLHDPESTPALAAHPELVARFGVADRRWLAVTPDHLPDIDAIGVRTLVRVCLHARGRTLGVITFASASSGRTFDVRDVDLASEVAARAALAVDNARLYREAQTALRVRTDFLSMAAHELRTPLTPIQLQLESLSRRLRRLPIADEIAAARMSDKLGVAIAQTRRLSSLVERLLDVSRIGSGRIDLRLEDVDLSEVVEQVVTRLTPDLENAGCALLLRTPGPVVGRWDRFRVEQVITNHVSNAIKYGAGKPIEVDIEATPTRATLRVRDHGIGIPLDKQPRIFEKFERAVGGYSYGGFGLGLWIVRQIVDALEGTVRVVSQPGEGSTFTVELPRRPAIVVRENEASTSSG